MKFDRSVTVVNGKVRTHVRTSNSVASRAEVQLAGRSQVDVPFPTKAWQDALNTPTRSPLAAAVERHTGDSQSSSKLTANISGYGAMGDGGFSNTQQTGYFGANAYTKTFEGILPEATEDTLVPYYRDIYYFDAIGGSTCDLMATFPYSDWQLSGVDTDRVPVYEDALARLGMRTLISEITLHYLVEGDFIGTLSYDSSARNFHDIFVHDRAFCRVIPAPFYSMSSMIQASANGRLNHFMNTPHKYRDMLLKHYPRHLLQKLSSGLHDLNPLMTMHVPRRTLADRFSGSSSYLRRLLPVYLLEKTLYRGSLIEANRRQRSTAHITMGDEEWTPTPEEMSQTLQAFKTTELDPLGAFIATRNGVQVNEILPAGEHYKWTDVSEQLVNIKLRSLGISEAFLSGDASFANADAAVGTFMQSISALRSYISFRVFQTKVFPLIALANGFYKRGAEIKKIEDPSDILFDLSNHKNLDIPKIVWTKDLSGGDASARLELLDRMSDKGFPIALRTIAAAAGQDVGMLLNDLKEDQALRTALAKLAPGAMESAEAAEEGANASGDSGSGDSVWASVSPSARNRLKRQITSGIGRVGMANRLLAGNDEDPEVHVLSRTGKRKAVHNEHLHMKQQNERIVKAMSRLADDNHRSTVLKSVRSKFGGKLPHLLNDAFMSRKG